MKGRDPIVCRLPGRALLCAIGAVFMAYGAALLLTGSALPQLGSAVTWLVGGVVVHDFLLAPVVIALAWLAGRVLPGWAQGSVAVAGIVLGSLTVLAIPVLGGWGRRSDNPTLLDRDYATGWLIVAGVIVVGAAVASVAVRSRGEHGGGRGERARRR